MSLDVDGRNAGGIMGGIGALEVDGMSTEGMGNRGPASALLSKVMYSQSAPCSAMY